MDESEETWDLMIFGDRGVGKSSFRLKVSMEHSNDGFEINPRIEGPVDRRVVIEGRPCVLWIDESLWTSHYALTSERCLGDIAEMIRRYRYFILMYDITSVESFDSIDFHHRFIKEVIQKYPDVNCSGPQPPHEPSTKKLRFLLIGMKSDLTDRRQVSRSQAESLANTLEGCIGFVETSVKQDASQSMHDFIRALRSGSMQRSDRSNTWLKKVFGRLGT
ncbi:hypothetical protein M413DRAFT_261544 [Hebeloma cylindrosporum]|uniref:small monomeric GTPase n=1 Tax=Hebeloma cylindrosporum TaxID=76867 RepID=A0A0C2Z0Q1_HEBCY|nr:hypothetical protein M413DRAFT_261544 [Hebeloma cylindrosporum h7]